MSMLSITLAQAPDWTVIEGGLGEGYLFRGGGNLSDLFNTGILNIVFFVAGVALLFYIITSGLSMMTSRGDPKALEGAKARITQAVIGFVIVFCAYWITQIVGLLLGLRGFGGTFI